MSAPRRILLTGATTPVGEALIALLLADEATEAVLAVGFEEAPSWAFEDPRLRYLRVDLCRERHLRRLIFGEAKRAEIEAVLDMATHRSAHASGKRARALNVEATRMLLRFSEQLSSVRRYVYRSFGEVYAVSGELPSLIDEEHPLSLSPEAPQWVRDRIEADLYVCAKMGLSRLSVAVLRCAECLAEGTGSQLWDYLRSKVCFRPMGYDPILNLLSVEDLAQALFLALCSEAQGIFTIPGKDTLPLSRIAERSGRLSVPVPGPLMSPLYRARRAAVGGEFRYGINRARLHFSGVLDGRRAARKLGYRPAHPIRWEELTGEDPN